MLSVIYPILGFFIELGQINASDIGACYDVLTTGLLFTATFFYDFYSRFRDCDGKTPCIVNTLSVGRGIFCALTIIIFIIIVVFPSGYISGIALQRGFYVVVLLSIYPFIIGLVEILRRAHSERKSKISRASV